MPYAGHYFVINIVLICKYSLQLLNEIIRKIKQEEEINETFVTVVTLMKNLKRKLNKKLEVII